MGWSGGGCSSLLFAIKYPHLVNKLITWGAFSYVDQEDAEKFKCMKRIICGFIKTWLYYFLIVFFNCRVFKSEKYSGKNERYAYRRVWRALF